MILRNSQKIDRFFNSDDALFHYTRKETAIENILPDKSLRFGHFSGTNDPQEYRPKALGGGGFGSDEDHEKIKEALFLVERFVKINAKFLSFCTNTVKHGAIRHSGLLKSRMWAQYGDNHEGACLVLSKANLIKSLKGLQADHELLFTDYIDYKDPDQVRLPGLHCNSSELSKRSAEEMAWGYFQDHHDNLLFNKQHDFRDESEFRVVYVNKGISESIPGERAVSIKESIKGVVFGDRFPHLYGPTINELVKDIELVPKRLFWQRNGYWLCDLWSH